MEWNLVQLFVDVVDAGSMTEAARRRNMTRSAVSQRIKALEHQANAQLLRRTTRELRPTDIGNTLYEHGKRIALQFEAAQFEVVSRSRRLNGLVRVSLPSGVGMKYIAPLLRRFALEHPEVALRVVFNNRLGNLIEADIDIALKVASSVPDDVVARELCELRWHFYCGPRFLETFGPCETPADLERAPFLSPHEGRKVPLELFCGAATASAVLTPRVSSENIRFLLDCALEDMGVTLLPSYFTQDMVEAGRLVQLLPQWYSNKNGSKLLIVTLPNRYPIPAAQALIELLRAEVPGLLTRA